MSKIIGWLLSWIRGEPKIIEIKQKKRRMKIVKGRQLTIGDAHVGNDTEKREKTSSL